MSTVSSLRIAASALTAQRLRMDVIAGNIAHAETTRTPSGGAYKRKRVVFSAAQPATTQLDRALGQARPSFAQKTLFSSTGPAPSSGVAVSGVIADPSPPRMTYDPGHPDADEQGYVAYPNVDITTEMADMLSATRAYEANVTVVNASKGMALKALEIGRG